MYKLVSLKAIHAVFGIAFLFLYGCSYSQENVLKQIKADLSVFEEITSLLGKDTSLRGQSFIYSDSVKGPELKEKIAYLKKKGLLNSYGRKDAVVPIYMSGPNCITFFVKKETVGTMEYEHILVYHNDGGSELSCIGSLYSVNQSEEIINMDLTVRKIDGSMTFITVKHDKETGL